MPLRYWQSDNRTSTAVLPHLLATQKGNLARPHSRSPQAVRKPEGPAMHCHLHRGDWNFHLTNEKKKKKEKNLKDKRASLRVDTRETQQINWRRQRVPSKFSVFKSNLWMPASFVKSLKRILWYQQWCATSGKGGHQRTLRLTTKSTRSGSCRTHSVPVTMSHPWI